MRAQGKKVPPGHGEAIGVFGTERGQHELGREAMQCLSFLPRCPHLHGQGQQELCSSSKGHCVSSSLPPQIRPETRK